MRLVVNKPGLFIGVNRGMVVIKEKGKRIAEAAPPQLSRVVVTTRGAIISSAFLRLISRYRVPLIVLSGTGFPVSKLSYVRGGAIRLKKMQYEAQSTTKAIYLAKRFAWGKLVNQKTLLYHAAKSRVKTHPEQAKLLFESSKQIGWAADRLKTIQEDVIEKARVEVMKIEADAAKVYWESFKMLLPEDVGFSGRRKRFDEPKDPVNIILNYCYGLLASEVLLAVEYAGLEPYIGFLHKDSPRRPALVMDLMEEFRQPIVDRTILRISRSVNLNTLVQEGKLTREGRLQLAKAFYSRLDEKVTFQGRSLPIGDHVLLQARRFALFILGKVNVYNPFMER